MEQVNYSQLSIEELKEMLEKERARRLLLEVQNNVLREYIGLEKILKGYGTLKSRELII